MASHSTYNEPEWTAWRLAGEQIVFLDLLHDRYFRLSEPANSEFRMHVSRGELEDWHCPTRLPRPKAWINPDTGPPAVDDEGLNVAGIAAALWIQRRLERRIRTLPFRQLLIEIRTTVERRVSGRGASPRTRLASIVGDFERARLLRSTPDQCLPQSLALVLRCASFGIRVHAVIGIKSQPFEAHCWAQHGRTVLTDPLETVTSFSPILVI